MTTDAGQGYLASKRNAYVVFTLLFALYLLDYMDRLVIVSLFPSLQREWGLSDTQCGLLVSGVYWSIVAFSLPGAVLVDRWSRRKSIGLMAMLWSLATAACALTRSFGQLFSARVAVGLGEAGYAPGGVAMISALFPEERRSGMLGIWNASIPMGSALGMALGGLIVDRWGWRHAFGIVALPGFLVGFLFFFVRDYRTVDLARNLPEESGSTGKAFQAVAAEFVRNRTLLFNNLAFAANTFVTAALLTWLPTYFHRTDGVPMAQAGVKGASVMALAIVGAPLGGWLADRWQQRRADARPLLAALSSAATAAVLFGAFALEGSGARYALLLAAGLSAVAFVPAAVSVTQDVVHPGLRATSAGYCVVLQHLLGSALGPAFVGAISDRTDLGTAMSFLPFFTLGASLLFLAASRYYPADAARVERVALVPEDRPPA